MNIGGNFITRRTLVLVTAGLLLMLGLAVAGPVMSYLLPAARAGAARALLSDLAAVTFDVLAAVALLVVAHQFQPTNPLRRIWLLLGLGIASYAVGDIFWTVLEVNSGFTHVPYPSPADLFYVLMYLFVVLGLFRAARAFARVTNVDVPLRMGIIMTFAVAAVVYTFVGAPIIVDSTSTVLEKVLGVAYPVLDIIALLGPAVFIAFVASAIGRRHASLHWWALAIGLGLMSLSDIAFTWLDWTGRYYSGHPVDFGWMLSLLTIAVAGSLAADCAGDHARARVRQAVPSS